MISNSAQQLIEKLATHVERGLDAREAEARLDKDGLNELQGAPPTPWWIRFVAQFKSLIVGLLFAAALLSGFLGDWVDAVAIVAILVLNAVLGFAQEERAFRSIRALRSLAAPHAKVRRDGELKSIPANRLVVGDILVLEAGDRVPADARLLESFNLQAQESSLTGESVPVSKDAAVELDSTIPLAERANEVFLGTTITAGKAVVLVTATGMKTEIGGIAKLLEETEQEQTPLQKRLAQLGQVLVAICLSLVAVIFILQVIRGGAWVDVFLTSISLAVAAIPEGLPAVVTVALAIGLQRMAKRNALIRKLPSVETLGCVTAICSDKTGTLTRNEMTVRKLWIYDTSWGVEGEGYAPHGGLYPLLSDSQPEAPPDANPTDMPPESLPKSLRRMLAYADQCNDAGWTYDATRDRAEFAGDPTEIALKVVAAKAKASDQWPAETVVHENPFDSDRKRMSRVVRDSSGVLWMLVKGAPETVLAASTHIFIQDRPQPLDDALLQLITRRNALMASEAMRVLGIAFRVVDPTRDAWLREESLVFLGLIGMIDPPRQAAVDAVASCRAAGIRPIMVTGDHPQTALAIARAVGIAEEKDSVILGSSIVEMSDEELSRHVGNCSVVARVSPLDKMRIVQAWKRSGHIVAMTGDGVNDAPALKAADIGIVMGITGTDVAKEASDMILTDDNFVSIVNAVEEGRGIYDNIQKSLHFLLACNSSEVIFMFVASLVGWPSPLLPIQILWINLITDGLPALALASEPLGKDLMQRPPRPINEPVLTGRRGRAILVHGLLLSIASLIGFGWIYAGDADRLDRARGAAFSILVLSQIFYSMACRDLGHIMPSLGVFTNRLLVAAAIGSILLHLIVMTIPWTSHLLGLAAMPWSDLPLVFAISLVPVTLVELHKLAR